MFKLLKNSVKDIITVAKEMNKFHIPLHGFLTSYENGDVNVSDDLVWEYTNIPPTMPNAFVTRVEKMTGEISFSIVVNTGYSLLPSHLKDALYKHELGHIVCQHMSTDVNVEYKSSLKDEKEADMYAFELGADMVSWFNYLMLNHPLLVSSDAYMVDRIKVFVDKKLPIDMNAYKYCKVLSRLNKKS